MSSSALRPGREKGSIDEEDGSSTPGYRIEEGDLEKGLQRNVDISFTHPSGSELLGASARTCHGNNTVSNRSNVGIPESKDTPVWSIFTLRQKRFVVFMVALAGFFSPISANIYFPALNTLSTHFHVSSGVINLTLTSYMVFQGIAPTFFGDLADIAGRRPAYLIGFAVYIGACVGIACCNSFTALLILGCLQSSGSSATIALASGVVADIATTAERGVRIGWATSGPMVAPALAPVLGGVFAESIGWRWIFWFLTIAAGIFVVPFAFIFPETGRNVVGNGSIPPQGWNMSFLNYHQLRKGCRDADGLQQTNLSKSQSSTRRPLSTNRKLRFPNPLRTLYILFEKDVALLLFYNSIIYCAFYDVMASAPLLFEQIYGYNALQIGLCFLPFGFGCLLAPQVSGKIVDWDFRRTAHKIGYEIVKGKANDLRTFPLEKTRIAVAIPMVFLGDAALLCYGWVLRLEIRLAAPLVLMSIIGLSLTGGFNVLSVMLVDLYPLSPATATAANNLIRCLMGAGATAIISYMIVAMGRGWCFTFIAAVVAILSPTLAILERWGPEWREERRVRVEGPRTRRVEAGNSQ